jgi:hypothetical protein
VASGPIWGGTGGVGNAAFVPSAIPERCADRSGKRMPTPSSSVVGLHSYLSENVERDCFRVSSSRSPRIATGWHSSNWRPEVSRRSGVMNVPADWQGQQYFETGHWFLDVTGAWMTAV